MIDKILNHSIDDVKNGYYCDETDKTFCCLICGEKFLMNEIFKIKDRLFNAEGAINLHIKEKHGNVFNVLCESDKKYNSLTDNQKTLLELFQSNLTDNEIAKKLDVSPSTVRHQRFTFKEKAKQAKTYLAIYELCFNNVSKSEEIIEIHDNATMVDERYSTTTAEEMRILNDCFYSLKPLKLKQFSSKEKKKIIILKRIAQCFEKDKRYKECEINDLLKSIYSDYVTIRRYLIGYGYLDRTNNGSEYWVK